MAAYRHDGVVPATTAFAATAVTLYKSPACGCCEKYVDYLRENGFQVQAVNQNDMSGIKKRYGVSHLASCHTAIVNGYVVEVQGPFVLPIFASEAN